MHELLTVDPTPRLPPSIESPGIRQMPLCGGAKGLGCRSMNWWDRILIDWFYRFFA
jgi:hypothetical protein